MPDPSARPGPDRRALLDRAVRYPYDRPVGSTLVDLATGTAAPLPHDDQLPDLVDGRTAVLAVGSNAAPEQLRRKFAGHGGHVPVVSIRLRDHDAVHAARVARYGAVPATLAPSPGTIVALHITFLTDGQLAVMHRSESLGAGYGLRELDGGLVEGPVTADRLVTYAATSGALLVEGAPLALAAVTASDRRFAAWHQDAVLAHVAGTLGRSAEDLVADVVADAGSQARVNAHLARLGSAQDRGAGPGSGGSAGSAGTQRP